MINDGVQHPKRHMNSSERKHHTARILNDEPSCVYGCQTRMVVWDIDCFHGRNELYVEAPTAALLNGKAGLLLETPRERQ